MNKQKTSRTNSQRKDANQRKHKTKQKCLLRVKTIIVSDHQSIPGTGRLKEIPSKS